ncbi:hypothetical protein C2G38_2204339 [Gigaspora rosea]|uniref:Protein kinase domain-containing protein n=1 Tax=Gigaspora rosea TaxID=44941 RepID=A0A397UV68_9GLOM|nr:hypothetical protein C2G38_2204338 [Gigaspora rosea]RIB11096.1 hypothetical protein C2G38_2204339 [Gigaspora rosea]
MSTLFTIELLFLKIIKWRAFLPFRGDSAIAIYGITNNPKMPVSQDSNLKGLFGILSYIAPEVLYTNEKEYTQKSGIYLFRIIMSEVFTGYLSYHNIPHNGDLDQVKSM